MRPTPYLLALAFLCGPLARADDAPPAKPAVDEGGPPKPPSDAKPAPDSKPTPDAKGAASGIAWVHDYDAAKTKAASEKKGLFVYMTPAWFT